jgi:hypothetical protein
MEEKLEDMMFSVDHAEPCTFADFVYANQEDWDTVLSFLEQLPTMKVGDIFEAGPHSSPVIRTK